ncbi:Haloacid dehalogenase-like hydrolase [Paenibacillus sp. yr247]|uniref:HAD hydrolase-like protein n=1 Tax=Paenibacillus sp. yr247 TaxID=1761880 RepID=UPI00088FACD5|nr:HAD hydrolase-like protein [Paenibacillus sp. yr247]SDP15084.1 Haloacid dehalogenase-like hydrolase [Paenibacillus sp. yr247]
MNILWDFDGTLFDTYPAYTEIFMDVLNHKYSAEEVSLQLKISFSHAISHFNLTEKQIKETNRRGALLKPEKLLPFDGVERVLQAVEKNVIMTHKPRTALLPILHHYEWDHYFVDIVSCDDGFPRIPDPTAYIHLNERNRVDLIIGDREIDILPGKSLGIKTCLFQNDTPGADYYLRHYKDFFHLIL